MIAGMNSFHNQTIPENDAAAEMLYNCIGDGHRGAAAMLARELEKSERIDVLFNVAWVNYISGDFARVIEYTDAALAAARKQTPNAGPRPRPATYQKLRAMDAESILHPMSRDYVAAFPDLAREDILMLGARVAHAAGMTAKRDGYLSDLRGPEFEQFKSGMKS